MNKYILLIKNLQNTKILSAKELAKVVHCSDRSIRNYVQEINSYKPIIQSSSKGYSIVDFDVDDVISNFSNTEVKEKELYIMNSLLLSSNGISKYSLQENLFVSDQTIDSYIKNINKQIKEKGLRIMKRTGFLYLKGEEENKRKLFKENLRINSYDRIEKELEMLCEEKKFDFQLIKRILIRNLDLYHIHINDYSLLNILTHLIVKIIRLNANKHIMPKKLELDKDRYTLQIKCSEQICIDLEKKLRIIFSNEEIMTLSLLLISKSDTNYYTYPMNTEVNKFVTNMIVKINHHYGIDLYDTEFINFFAMHIRNLLKRIELKNYNANPLFEQVLNFNSLVYDIAVFVASEFKIEFQIDLPKEEIAFLAFHIGSIVVKKNILDEDIYVAIELFDFYRYADVLKTKLSECLPNYVHVDIVTEESVFLDSFSYDLTISTSINTSCLLPTKQNITISPILTDQEMDKIKHEVNLIKKKKKQYRIQTYFEQFFNYNLFENNVYFSDSKKYIEYMSNKLSEYHLVSDDFLQSVLDREKITPTSFDNGVAIPHALNCSAIKNCAYVIINDRATPWGAYPVHMIVLIGINEKDQHEFKFLYDTLLNKLNESNFLKKAVQCKEYKDFLEFISEI